MLQKPPKVSLCMIVRNEESNLPACLESVKGLFDEIIIVDTGSTDRTKEIALQYGAIVSDFEWIDDFSAARNKSLELATGQWIFWLDADHRVDQENYYRLKVLFEGLKDEKIFFLINERFSHPSSGFHTYNTLTRLFRSHPQARWIYRVHEQITSSLQKLGYQLQTSDIIIQHIGYDDPRVLHKKLMRDYCILEKEENEIIHNRDLLPHVYYELSLHHRRMRHPSKALPYLQYALSNTEKDHCYYNFLSLELMKVYRDLNQWENALYACKQTQALMPSSGELIFEESYFLEKLGQRDKAQERLIELCAPGKGWQITDPSLLDMAHYNLHKFLLQNNTAESEKHLIAITEQNHQISLGWLNLTFAYISKMEWTKALSACQKAKALLPEEVSVHFWESWIENQLGNYSREQFLLLQLIENYNSLKNNDSAIDLAIIYQNLGASYSIQSDSIQAEKNWKMALKENPKFAPAWLSLTSLWITQAQWEKLSQAITYLETTIHYDEMAIVLKAKLLAAQGKIPEAMDLLKECITNHSEMIWPKIIFGEIAVNTSQELPYAEKVLQKVLTMDPNNVPAKQLLNKMPHQQ